MFDVSFSELLVIAVVALIVIGPERLPKVARTVGHLLGRMQRYVREVKADINREMQLDEFRQLHHEVKNSVQDLEKALWKEADLVEKSIKEPVSQIKEECETLQDDDALLHQSNFSPPEYEYPPSRPSEEHPVPDEQQD